MTAWKKYTNISPEMISLAGKFQLIIQKAAREKSRIESCYVNLLGEAKLIKDPIFISSPSPPDRIGFFLGVPVYVSHQQTIQMIFIVDTPNGPVAVSESEILPLPPGPIFITTITKKETEK